MHSIVDLLIQILKFSRFHCQQSLRTFTLEKLSYLTFNQSSQSIYTFLKKAKHLLSTLNVQNSINLSYTVHQKYICSYV